MALIIFDYYDQHYIVSILNVKKKKKKIALKIRITPNNE